MSLVLGTRLTRQNPILFSIPRRERERERERDVPEWECEEYNCVNEEENGVFYSFGNYFYSVIFGDLVTSGSEFIINKKRVETLFFLYSRIFKTTSQQQSKGRNKHFLFSYA